MVHNENNPVEQLTDLWIFICECERPPTGLAKDLDLIQMRL